MRNLVFCLALLGLSGAPSVTMATGTAHAVYTFSAFSGSGKTNTDGASPYAAVVQDAAGNFYGATAAGGANGNGTLYEVTTSGSLNVLHTFGAYAANSYANTDGAVPAGALVADAAGNLYGTTVSGGTGANGTVFKYANGSLTTLHLFAPFASGATTNADGAAPQSALAIGPDGALYGTALKGGANGNGVIFRIDPAGTYTSLHTFGAYASASAVTNADGALPYAALTYNPSDGDFYGSTEKGGKYGFGTLFRISTSGALTVLYSFSGPTDGASPAAALLHYSDGNFYGTTAGGGANGNGTIFRVTPAGVLTTLHSFAALTGVVNSDGATPGAALVVDTADGNLYGTTINGGTYGLGAIFSVNPVTGAFTAQYSFVGGADGATPYGSLLWAANGTLYGTSTLGGKNGNGTVYSVTLGSAAPLAFSLASGSYTSTQTVTLSDVTAGVTIYYTTDGTTPTTASAVYSAPLSVASSETILAVAAGNGYPVSGVAIAQYTISSSSGDGGKGGSGSVDLIALGTLTMLALLRRRARQE